MINLAIGYVIFFYFDPFRFHFHPANQNVIMAPLYSAQTMWRYLHYTNSVARVGTAQVHEHRMLKSQYQAYRQTVQFKTVNLIFNL